MKDLKISKELLSEVLNYEVDAFLGINKNEIDYTCCRDENEGYIDISINLYEFAFKCKEWAYTNKYRLSSGQHRLNTKQEHYINNQIASYFCSVYYITNDDSDIQIDANTEPEAIIKACNWILENRK